MDPSEIQPYLDSFTNFESKLHKLSPDDFNLNRIIKFLDLAGDPAARLKIVHVAGTKGKGSTCAFLAGILKEAGYKVGLYTSPHLHRVNERIRILSLKEGHSKDPFARSISDEELACVLASLRPFAAKIINDGHILTYFEVLTVAALCHFAKEEVDIAILETGLGGRLDATNAVDSSMAIITPVSLDHMKILGPTLKQIAFEKAGIIKNSHQQVVIAPQEEEAMKVILDRCHEFGINPVLADVSKYGHLKVGLKGRHQLINAAVAIKAAGLLRKMGFKIDDHAIDHGLKNVRWPGRFELMGRSPDIVVDCAHNEASARTLVQVMDDLYHSRRVVLVLGVSQDKDIAAICRALKPKADKIILTKSQHPRAHAFSPGEGQKYFGPKPFEIVEDPKAALESALRAAQPQDVVLVTGSIFIVAEAMDILGQKHVPV